MTANPLRELDALILTLSQSKGRRAEFSHFIYAQTLKGLLGLPSFLNLAKGSWGPGWLGLRQDASPWQRCCDVRFKKLSCVELRMSATMAQLFFLLEVHCA